MTPQDNREFTRILGGISALYNKPMSPAMVDLYWGALQDFELQDIKQALQAHVKHPDKGQFMPKPSEVLCLLQGSGRDQALRAWSLVTRAIRERGGYASVVFDDARTHAVVQDMGGWVTLCETTLAELPFRGHDFGARYAGFVDKAPGEYPRVLTGRLANSGRAEPPILLGNVQKAQVVYQAGSGLLESTLSAFCPQQEVSMANKPFHSKVQARIERVQRELAAYDRSLALLEDFAKGRLSLKGKGYTRAAENYQQTREDKARLLRTQANLQAQRDALLQELRILLEYLP